MFANHSFVWHKPKAAKKVIKFSNLHNPALQCSSTKFYLITFSAHLKPDFRLIRINDPGRHYTIH